MASLMDMIMMQRQGMDDPRAAADMQAMELQNMARTAQQPAASAFGPLPRPSFAGSLSPVQSFAPRAPMLLGAPMPQVLPPPAAVPPVAYSGFGGQDSPRERLAMAPAPVPVPPPPAPVGAPMQLASAAPSVRESFMQRLLSGPNYQSNNMPALMTPQGPTPSGAPMPQQVNWGDADDAADFFRAEQVARQMGLLG